MIRTIIKPPFYYRFLIWLASPIYRLMVYKKSRDLPHYALEVATRFGKKYPNRPISPVVWCHAVSLGELNTAYPLLRLLLQEGYRLWITSTTQTGYARVKVLFADELASGEVQHSFVPIDRSDVIQRFVAHVRPEFALFVETELWANTLYELAKQKIPTIMVNARLTEKSYKGYLNFPSLSASMMANLNKIITQENDSAMRFMQLMQFDNDINKVAVSDSLKWVSSPSLSFVKKHEMNQLKAQLNRPIWVAASTHEGEETAVLEVHKKLLTINPNALLILVPRHPERFDEVANLCGQMMMDIGRRSQGDELGKTAVYLADSMGELMMWYQLCDVAFVGGSLVDKGGHTPIEPASLGKPIIMGRYTHNADVLVRELVNVHALQVVDDERSLFEVVEFWLTHPEDAIKAGVAGCKVVHDKSTAATQQFEFIMQCVGRSRGES